VIAAGISSFVLARDKVMAQRVDNMRIRKRITEQANREAYEASKDK